MKLCDAIIQVDVLNVVGGEKFFEINKIEYVSEKYVGELQDDAIYLIEDLIEDKKMLSNCRYNLSCNIIEEYTPSSPSGPEEYDAYLQEAEIVLIETGIIEKYYEDELNENKGG